MCRGCAFALSLVVQCRVGTTLHHQPGPGVLLGKRSRCRVIVHLVPSSATPMAINLNECFGVRSIGGRRTGSLK